MIVESKPKLSTKVDIDLDEDIVILNWDISTLNPDQMHIVGELLQKKAKQQKLREEKNREK